MGTLDMLSVDMFIGSIPPLFLQVLKNQCKNQLVFSLISGYLNYQHSLDCRQTHPPTLNRHLSISGSLFFKGSRFWEDIPLKHSELGFGGGEEQFLHK